MDDFDPTELAGFSKSANEMFDHLLDVGAHSELDSFTLACACGKYMVNHFMKNEMSYELFCESLDNLRKDYALALEKKKK